MKFKNPDIWDKGSMIMEKAFPILVFIILLFTGTQIAAQERSASPIPQAERGIVQNLAEPWFEVSKDNNILEGAIFDKAGNLLFCDVSERKVKRLTPDKKLDTLVELEELQPGGLAWHGDGRLFIAALDLAAGKGGILAWEPETGKLETIIGTEKGFWPNDLVCDHNGGLYFSDFRGSASKPVGGIYYLHPDLKTISPVIPNMGQANGVALSPDGKTLWATEFAKNRLHRAILTDAVTISPTGSAIPYHFIGAAPDSMRVDARGNVYVALYGQGRAMIFNSNGIPIGQVLLPERENGKNLLSTSLALDPESKAMFIVTSNAEAGQPAGIFKGSSLSSGQKPMNAR